MFYQLVLMLGFVVGWRGGDKNGLGDEGFKFFKFQGPVIQRGGQAEAVLHQVFFTRAVAFVHGANLPDADVAFVDKE